MPRIASLRLIALVLLCAACATTPPRSAESEPAAWVRLLDVQPAIGSSAGPDAIIRVRAEYRIPREASGHRANLMFVTEAGTLRSVGNTGVELDARSGVIELSAQPAAVMGGLRHPLTAVVMIMGPPGEISRADTTPGAGVLPPEVAARLQQLRDSAAAAGDSIRVRRVSASAPMLAVTRSRRIFFNGAGPAPGVSGTSLFPEAVEEYRSLGGAKAFALAVDEQTGRRTWGYGWGFTEPDSAIARALRECRSGVERRSLNATCKVFVSPDSIPPASS